MVAQSEAHGETLVTEIQFPAKEQTPSLPVPRPANDATREKQIPFRKRPVINPPREGTHCGAVL